jgi:hypothetical protein
VGLDRRPYRSVEDVLRLVEWAMGRKGTQAIAIEPGLVRIQQADNAPDLEPVPDLPGDDLLDRIRLARGVGIGHISARDCRDALMVALAFFHRHGLIPSHFLCSDRTELYRRLYLDAPGDPGFVETGLLWGWEIVESRDLPEGTIFLCGGVRRGGKLGDVTAAVRLEVEDDEEGRTG